MVQGRIWRVLGGGMRGPSGRGRPANCRRQGPKFGPKSALPSTMPRDVNWIQRVIRLYMNRAGIAGYGSRGEVRFSVGGGSGILGRG